MRFSLRRPQVSYLGGALFIVLYVAVLCVLLFQNKESRLKIHSYVVFTCYLRELSVSRLCKAMKNELKMFERK
jgi:hypothetical protein